jgi:hypothetical protein
MKFDFSQENNQFVYDLEDATNVVMQNLSQHLLLKYFHEDISFILKQQMEYLSSIGLMYDEDQEMPICEYPVTLDQEALENYIMTNAIRNDIYLSYDELDDILDAELVYYKMNGAIGDIGEILN